MLNPYTQVYSSFLNAEEIKAVKKCFTENTRNVATK